MSRFRPTIGATDSSNFINVAALEQQGRQATQDRQLDTRRLQADIASKTNEQRLAANEQAIQLYAIQQENELALKNLVSEMEGLRGTLLDRALTRKQEGELGRESLGLRREELGLRREELESTRDIAGRELDLRATEGEADRTLRREEGAAERKKDLDLAQLSEAGASVRQQVGIEAQAELQNREIETQLELARQGNEAALDQLNTRFNQEITAQGLAFYDEKEKLALLHKYDTALLSKRLAAEAQTVDPAVADAITQTALGLDEANPRALASMYVLAKEENAREAVQSLINVKLIQIIESGSKEEVQDALVVLAPLADDDTQRLLRDQSPIGYKNISGRSFISEARRRNVANLLRQQLGDR